MPEVLNGWLSLVREVPLMAASEYHDLSTEVA